MSRKSSIIPVYFRPEQLNHKPLYEWTFGEKIEHPETTARAESIVKALQQRPELFKFIMPKSFPINIIREVHDDNLITLYKTCRSLPVDKTFYPSIFPKREYVKPNPLNIYHSGFYCFDSGTPLNSTTWQAAAWSAACATDAARDIVKGKTDYAYALCRPPGHHASSDMFGGYCYFNNAAIATKALGMSKVAILDIDFHHGNGTQNIFYNDGKVLFISIHGDPKDFYPFYTGFKHEKGLGKGYDCNMNIPLTAGVSGKEYLAIIANLVLPKIRKFRPFALIVSAGFDTFISDPIGAFSLQTEDYYNIAKLLKTLDLPTLVVQEGGYAPEFLGENVSSFLQAFN